MGAGGTEGGGGRFFIGLAMLVAGGYLFFNSIQVISHFHMGGAFFSMGGYSVTGGLVLVPFVFGVVLIFYNARNPIGWLLASASLIMLGVGVISKINFRMAHMSAFDIIIILTLFLGGLGLFLSSLRERPRTP
jgi:uncharacterized protein